MGKIRTREIKTASFELMEKYNDKWKKTFDENKKVANELGVFKNKRSRNKVIGYLTRKVSRQKKK